MPTAREKIYLQIFTCVDPDLEIYHDTLANLSGPYNRH